MEHELIENIRAVFRNIVKNNYNDVFTITASKFHTRFRILIQIENVVSDEIVCCIIRDVYDEIVFRNNIIMQDFVGNILSINFDTCYKRFSMLINLDPR